MISKELRTTTLSKVITPTMEAEEKVGPNSQWPGKTPMKPRGADTRANCARND